MRLLGLGLPVGGPFDLAPFRAVELHLAVVLMTVDAFFNGLVLLTELAGVGAEVDIG